MPDDGGAKPAITFAGRFTASAIAACFAEASPWIPSSISLSRARARFWFDSIRFDLARRCAPSPWTRPRSGSSSRRPPLQGPKPQSTAACSAQPPPSPGRKELPRSGRGSSRVSTGSASTEDSALVSTSPYVHDFAAFSRTPRIHDPPFLPTGFEQVKSFYVGEDHVGDVPLTKKIAAGFTTGAIAITVANPTDLVKVRLQAEGKLAPGAQRRYAGAMDAYAKIARQEGVAALWTGLGPNVARNAIINAAELASYDQVKQTILKIPGFKDDVVTHLFSGLGAGFFAVCIGSPVDVVKSRMMGDSAYKSTIDCFVQTLKNDFTVQGPLAFYKGFLPNFARLGSWNVIMFLTLEQVQKVFVKKPTS
ncbi:hypothetical protein PR202_ga22813 [Eleusine coracana subsp. coracana]|uniref:Uncharacterized protein n=1 Tax=Eleusine coracana subsp. coracana TaxID=191504 RepID=A0AAV5D2P1_ELECO|nr:hypothetical protein PR202_ga22813 [Eleusine coracana subsp. coracana]